MKQTIKRLLCLLASVIFAGVSAFAQVTTSSLGGRIVDENGTPVVGASRRDVRYAQDNFGSSAYRAGQAAMPLSGQS